MNYNESYFNLNDSKNLENLLGGNFTDLESELRGQTRINSNIFEEIHKMGKDSYLNKIFEDFQNNDSSSPPPSTPTLTPPPEIDHPEDKTSFYYGIIYAHESIKKLKTSPNVPYPNVPYNEIITAGVEAYKAYYTENPQNLIIKSYMLVKSSLLAAALAMGIIFGYNIYISYTTNRLIDKLDIVSKDAERAVKDLYNNSKVKILNNPTPTSSPSGEELETIPNHIKYINNITAPFEYADKLDMIISDGVQQACGIAVGIVMAQYINRKTKDKIPDLSVIKILNKFIKDDSITKRPIIPSISSPPPISINEKVFYNGITGIMYTVGIVSGNYYYKNLSEEDKNTIISEADEEKYNNLAEDFARNAYLKVNFDENNPSSKDNYILGALLYTSELQTEYVRGITNAYTYRFFIQEKTSDFELSLNAITLYSIYYLQRNNTDISDYCALSDTHKYSRTLLSPTIMNILLDNPKFALLITGIENWN